METVAGGRRAGAGTTGGGRRAAGGGRAGAGQGSSVCRHYAVDIRRARLMRGQIKRDSLGRDDYAPDRRDTCFLINFFFSFTVSL